MINNRQNGRRRGRGGGQRPPSNTPNPGNRQDNRQRGNAAQLHEKYKALARDTQLSGDRVQTEYYLQFADHYFRVLNEGRARFEEQRPPRDDFNSEEEEDQDEGGNVSEGEEREERDERPSNNDGEFRNGRNPRQGEDRNRHQRPRNEVRDQNPNQNQSHNQDEDESDERISLDVLPPAIAADTAGEAPSAPRRRTRRPRPDDEAEIKPAA